MSIILGLLVLWKAKEFHRSHTRQDKGAHAHRTETAEPKEVNSQNNPDNITDSTWEGEWNKAGQSASLMMSWVAGAQRLSLARYIALSGMQQQPH